jgi:hypothetical protein
VQSDPRTSEPIFMKHDWELLLKFAGTFQVLLKSDNNNKHFTLFTCVRWLKEKLITNLEPNSVLVIDNAPHHNLQDMAPTSSSSKDAMKNWLRVRNSSFCDTILKVLL